MKFPRVKSRQILSILIPFLLVSALPGHGQISALKNAVEGKEAEKPAQGEKQEDARKRLDQWQKEAREALARLGADGIETALPEGITPAELDDRRRDLEQIALTVTRSLKNLTAIEDARKDLATSRAEEAAWTGFKEAPPYSLLMIDEMLNERDAIKAKLTSYQSALSNYERILATTMAETKAAEEGVNNAIVAVQGAVNGNNEAARWRLDAARAKARLFVARVGLIQNSCESLKDRIAAAKIDLALLDRKVKTATASSRFGDEELARLAKISTERKSALQKEISGVSKRLNVAITARNQAQAALDDIDSSGTPDSAPEGLKLAKFRLEVADGRVEAMQSLIEGLEGLIQLENLRWKAYQDRRAIIDAAKPEDRNKALQSITTFAENLRAWENVVANDIGSCGADLSKIESRAASIASDDPRFALLNEQRAAKSEKLASLQRLSQAVISERKLIRRWIADYSPKPDEAGFLERISMYSTAAWDKVKGFWSIKVMSFEEKVELDGQTLTGKVPVTLGMLMRALLFFVIGYWVASLVATRIQGGLVTRGRIAEHQAKTLRNWAMIVVGVFLALGTLAFLKIPLTVFAFLGGALAIGLGFGTQTLIKNFISGIIVLAERKVRVGDILDVDGIVGTVVEVNTRSSIIRSADDVETMIPNSMFLENRVTNRTLSSSKMRRNLSVGVAYGTSPQVVMEILTESAARHGLICKDPAPFAVFENFGDNALMFCLYFWVELGGGTNAMIVTSDLRLMIEKRFTEIGVGIPFPQRDMHLTTDKPLEIRLSPSEPEVLSNP